jgi:hypothetical protein
MNPYILQLIRPFDIDGSLIRYGNKSDGGYVVNKEYIKKSNILYTYGVGIDISFEQDLLTDNSNYLVHMYDHTINGSLESNDYIFFHKEGLGLTKVKNKNNFLNHIKINNHEDKKITLKIDIEGDEIDFFNEVDISKFNNVIQMIVEFHCWNVNVFSKMLESISKINKYFYCIHFHHNNHLPLLNVKNILCPQAIELTFINKLYVNEYPNYKNQKYPIDGLDYSSSINKSNEASIDEKNYLKEWSIDFK